MTTITLDPNRDIMLAYPTPIVNTNIGGSDSLNKQLLVHILDLQKANPGIKRSNHGGWHSPPHLFQSEHSAIQTLRSLIDTFVRQVAAISIGAKSPFPGKIQYDAWANINQAHNYNKTHHHPGCHWSGVYYVESTFKQENEQGRIEFQDPRGPIHMMPAPGQQPDSLLQIDPRPGKILIFPSYLNHSVLPFRSEGRRVSIAFNAKLADH